MCARCQAESADYAAKAEAAYAANREAAARLTRAVTREGELTEQIRNIIAGQDAAHRGLGTTELACVVIDTVREFDERTALMREAKDDHDQQNNEDPNDPPY